MDNLARKRQPAPHLEYALVAAVDDAAIVVELQGSRFAAQQSASCLLRPAPGDEVLLSLDSGGRCFILAVLQRAAPQTTQELAFTGDVRLQVQQGSLQLMSETDLTLAAGQSCNCLAREVELLADTAQVRVERANVLAKVLRANLRTVGLVAGNLETTARRWTRRLRDLFSYVEEHSEYQSRNSRHLVEETLTMHAKNAFHVADEIVKVDGEQVQLG